jgi:hypothetical protein
VFDVNFEVKFKLGKKYRSQAMSGLKKIINTCLAQSEHLSQGEGIGPVGSQQTFLPMIESLAAPSHI